VTYPRKAKDKNIQGRVEVQLLTNEDGEVIFADARMKIAGRIIIDFKDGQVVVPKRVEFE